MTSVNEIKNEVADKVEKEFGKKNKRLRNTILDILDDEFNETTTVISQQKAIAEMNEKYGYGSGYTYYNNGNGHNNEGQKQDGKKQGGNDKSKSKEKSKPVFPVFKYSKPTLHESVIINGIPYFVTYDSVHNRLATVEKIEESSRVLRPPNPEEYPQYIPYEFDNAEQLNEYFKRAKTESIGSIYQRVKEVVKKYNDQDEHKQNLLAIDIVWSYRQDCFSTTHYIVVTGDNDSGKSTIGNTFEAIGYSCANMTSPSAANIFRALGKIEAGQCTLILDESDGIAEDPYILNILKTGTDKSKKIPKTNTNTWNQEWFYTYCPKIIIGEKSPNKLKAKGLLDRAFVFSVFASDTALNIKEVTNPEEKDPHLRRELVKLLALRKLMLLHRLIHYKDAIPDIDVGVKRRNEELCKPYIRLFYGSKVQKEVEQTFQIFLNEKNEKKSTSIEAILVPVIIKLVEKEGSEILSRYVWDFIKLELRGPSSTYSDPDIILLPDCTLYKSTITKLFEDKFEAKTRHTNKGNITVFDLDKLRKLEKIYSANTIIKTTPKNVIEDDGDGSEGSEGSWENAPISFKDSKEKVNGTTDNNNRGNYENNVNTTQNDGPKDTQVPVAYSNMPSHPSPSSPHESRRINNNNHTPDGLVESQLGPTIEEINKEHISRTSDWSDTWECDSCKLQDDKYGMIKHVCRGIDYKKEGVQNV